MFNITQSAIDDVKKLTQMLPKDEVTNAIVKAILKKLEEAKGSPAKEFFDGLSESEVEAFIDYLNPKKENGERTFTTEEYVRDKEDLANLRKLIRNSQTLRAGAGDEKAIANMKNTEELSANSSSGKNFLSRIKRFTKTKVFTGIVAGALLVTTVLATGFGIAYNKKSDQYVDLQKRYDYVLSERYDAFDALEQFGFDFDYDQNSRLSDIISSVAEGTKKQHKSEVDQAYAMVVKVFEDNGISLADVYNEQTGEYDVSTLGENMGSVLADLLKNTNNLKALEGQVESVLKVVKIPQRDQAGNPVREDGEIVYKTIADYATLGDAISDIGVYYQQSLDAEIADIGSVVDFNLETLGAEKSVKDFATINDAIDYLGEFGGSKISDLQDQIKQHVETISNLRTEIGEMQSDYDKIMKENQSLQEKIEELQEQKSSNTNQNVSDEGSKEETADPVDGEEKGDESNSGESRPGSKDQGGSGSNYDSDESEL